MQTALYDYEMIIIDESTTGRGNWNFQNDIFKVMFVDYNF